MQKSKRKNKHKSEKTKGVTRMEDEYGAPIGFEPNESEQAPYLSEPFGMESPPPAPSFVMPPATPNAKPFAAFSTVAAAPIPARLKQKIRTQRKSSDLIFTVLIPLLLAVMAFNSVYARPGADYSQNAFVFLVLVLLGVVLWDMVFLFLDSKTPKPTPLDLARVNEVYEQGALSTSAMERVVIPFDEVVSFVETEHYLALYGKTGEIVWLATDVTASEARCLMEVFAAHLPQTVFLRKGALLPQKPFETAPPSAILFETPRESLPAAWSAKEATAYGYGAMLRRGAPMFFLMSAVLANVLCDGFGWFAEDPLAGRFLLFAAGALICAGMGRLLVAWEQTAATKAENGKGVTLHLLSDGVRIESGAEFIVVPTAALHTRRDKNGTLLLLLYGRALAVSYPVFSRSSEARRLFNL